MLVQACAFCCGLANVLPQCIYTYTPVRCMTSSAAHRAFDNSKKSVQRHLWQRSHDPSSVCRAVSYVMSCCSQSGIKGGTSPNSALHLDLAGHPLFQANPHQQQPRVLAPTPRFVTTCAASSQRRHPLQLHQLDQTILATASRGHREPRPDHLPSNPR